MEPGEGAAGKDALLKASGCVVGRLWERLGRLRPIIYISKRGPRKRGKSKKERLHGSKCFLEGLRLRNVHQSSHGFTFSKKQRFSIRLLFRPRLAKCALVLEPFAHF